jgi:hypothetical protein
VGKDTEDPDDYVSTRAYITENETLVIREQEPGLEDGGIIGDIATGAGLIKGALLGIGRAATAAVGKTGIRIMTKSGTVVTGLTAHGVDRAIGDLAKRAGVKPAAILDALKNPKRIRTGIDQKGRPYEVFHGADARVVVNPQTGKIVSMNPLSRKGANP